MQQIEITEADILNKTCYGVNPYEVEFVLRKTNSTVADVQPLISGLNIKIDEHGVCGQNEFLRSLSDDTIFRCKF